MGAILALLLIIVAATGTALIWKDAYLQLAFAPQTQNLDHSAEARASIAQAAESIFGAQSINRIQFGSNQFSISRVDLIDGTAAYLSADGTVLDQWSPNARPEDWLLDLHHRLLSGDTGLYVVGFTGIAALLMLLMGFLSYWPKRSLWRAGLIPAKLRRPQLLLSHRNIGFLLFIPLLLIVLSGVVLCFPESTRNLFYSSEDESYGSQFGDGVDLLTGSSKASWERALSRASAVFPNARITGLIWPNFSDSKIILMRNEGEWAERGNSQVHITEYDGMMGVRIDALDLSRGERLYKLMNTLHRGDAGGWVYDLLLTLVGLGMMYLGAIGLFSFIKVQMPPRRSQ